MVEIRFICLIRLPIIELDGSQHYEKNGIDKDDKVSLDSALTKLNDRGRHVLMARYIYGKTQMEIADDLGVSQAQVSRIEKNAIRYLRRYMD